MGVSDKQYIHISTSQQGDSFFGKNNNFGDSSGSVWEYDSLGDGQISVDVYTTKTHVVVIAPMAGADTTAINVTLHDDVLTIRGVRELPIDRGSIKDVAHTECFWGSFSRTIVLPHTVFSHKVQAEYVNGVLIIELTKAHIESKIPVHIVDE